MCVHEESEYHGDMHIHSCTIDVPVEASLNVNGMITDIQQGGILSTTGPAEHARDVGNKWKEGFETKGVGEFEEMGKYTFC